MNKHLHLCILHLCILADAFIQSDLQLHSGYTISLVCVYIHVCIYMCVNKQLTTVFLLTNINKDYINVINALFIHFN